MKLKAKMEAENDSSDSSIDDEGGEMLTEELEEGFFKVLSRLKKKDPKLYDENIRFFPSQATKNDCEIKNETGKTSRREYKDWLKGQIAKVEDDGLKKDLEALHDFWTNPKLNKGEQFLRDYILNKKFLDKDDNFNPEEEIEKLEEEEKEIEEQNLFEQSYNNRFENPDEPFLVQTHPNKKNSKKECSNIQNSANGSRKLIEKLEENVDEIDLKVNEINIKNNKGFQKRKRLENSTDIESPNMTKNVDKEGKLRSPNKKLKLKGLNKELSNRKEIAIKEKSDMESSIHFVMKSPLKEKKLAEKNISEKLYQISDVADKPKGSKKLSNKKDELEVFNEQTFKTTKIAVNEDSEGKLKLLVKGGFPKNKKSTVKEANRVSHKKISDVIEVLEAVENISKRKQELEELNKESPKRKKIVEGEESTEKTIQVVKKDSIRQNEKGGREINKLLNKLSNIIDEHESNKKPIKIEIERLKKMLGSTDNNKKYRYRKKRTKVGELKQTEKVNESIDNMSSSNKNIENSIEKVQSLPSTLVNKIKIKRRSRKHNKKNRISKKLKEEILMKQMHSSTLEENGTIKKRKMRNGVLLRLKKSYQKSKTENMTTSKIKPMLPKNFQVTLVKRKNREKRGKN